MNQNTAPAAPPSAEDLSMAQVEGSWAFGVTNMSGKVLTGIATALSAGGTVGVLQGFGVIGTLMGAAVGLGPGIGLLAASAGVGAIAYYLGNFDDSRIKAFNQKIGDKFALSSRQYDRTEEALLKSLQGMKLDPATQMMPLHTLGRLTVMSDSKIAGLAPEQRLDVYRTQMEVSLSKNGMLGKESGDYYKNVCAGILANQDYTMEQKAEYFRQGREKLNSVLAKPGEKPQKQKKPSILSRLWRGAAAVNNIQLTPQQERDLVSVIEYMWEKRQDSAATLDPLPDISGSQMAKDLGIDNIGKGEDALQSLTPDSNSSPSSLTAGSKDGNEAALGMAAIAAGVAAAAASYISVGFAAYKNFIDRAPAIQAAPAEKPVDLKVLRTGEAEIRALYAPAQGPH